VSSRWDTTVSESERNIMAGKARAVAAVTEESEDAKRKRLLRKAYSEATQELRVAHRADFDRLYGERAAALGVEWQPRPTAEQKAEQEFEALVEQYPYLLDRVEALRDSQGEGEGDEG